MYGAFLKSNANSILQCVCKVNKNVICSTRHCLRSCCSLVVYYIIASSFITGAEIEEALSLWTSIFMFFKCIISLRHRCIGDNTDITGYVESLCAVLIIINNEKNNGSNGYNFGCHHFNATKHRKPSIRTCGLIGNRTVLQHSIGLTDFLVRSPL